MPGITLRYIEAESVQERLVWLGIDILTLFGQWDVIIYE